MFLIPNLFPYLVTPIIFALFIYTNSIFNKNQPTEYGPA